MPDRYGFDHLGDEVRCIEEDCGARGPLWVWTIPKRARHRAAHERARRAQIEREQRARLAAFRREREREIALQRGAR